MNYSPHRNPYAAEELNVGLTLKQKLTIASIILAFVVAVVLVIRLFG
jgi:hypothetical protein